MNEEKGLLKREIKEKTSFDGIVVGRRRLYVYSENYRKKISIDDLILNILSEKGPLTRDELVELTHIPRTTLYDNLARLIDEGYVKKESVPRKTRGRPKILFKLA
ncbi:MAG: winged helix-turn-helix transcriptional regulator [Candidatus Heimdallarchaeum aukensis]|uniref:Winged helix-turn-helix transcriptional regulator n=2 Tax=Candidatus Heimdallarchaeum TaxID=3053649 RepID=A0A9Y1FN87_9ARCH|nr:MAG: winged helix-turn-helix transcriptional regulator [Candidatus Heimdallarchaeum aukensis]UJG42659.1 MAG: winged helix-turn-helix transcriptional regulator [Candidatus Heimdallarchaeum endolithica]